MYHQPVLLHESINMLNVSSGGTYVDLTYGGGGHSKLILEKIGYGKLIAFDNDYDAINNKIDDERLILVNQNFRFISNFLNFYQAVPVDGIFGDLGISSHQIDEPSRGFSYMHPNEKLDMRMNTDLKKSASTILNSYSEDELSKIFFQYAEIPFSRKLASDIANYRKNKNFNTINDILVLLEKFVNHKTKFSIYSRIFQALRIEVNEEIEALKEMLNQSLSILKSGGRIAIISYHSLEDRIVKNFFKSGNLEGIIEKDPLYGTINTPFKVLTNKPIGASEDEIKTNIRSRSAKLRVAIKK